jgi:predicted site-specific integrase-resolvase
MGFPAHVGATADRAGRVELRTEDAEDTEDFARWSRDALVADVKSEARKMDASKNGEWG